MIRIRSMTPALAAAALGVLAIAPGAVAAPPSPQVLNPAPPDLYTCKPLGGGTLCTGSVHEVKVSEEQGELVCVTGTGFFLIHDNGLRRPEPDPHLQRGREPDQPGHPREVGRHLLEQPAQRQDGPVHADRQDHRPS